jgi:hypothetical protein
MSKSDQRDQLPMAQRFARAAFLGVAAVAVANSINTAMIYSRVSAAADRAFSDTADGFLNQNTFRLIMQIHIVGGAIAAAVAVTLAYSLERRMPLVRWLVLSSAILGALCVAPLYWINAAGYRRTTSSDEVQGAAHQTSAVVPTRSHTITDICVVAGFGLLVAIAISLAWPRPARQESSEFSTA